MIAASLYRNDIRPKITIKQKKVQYIKICKRTELIIELALFIMPAIVSLLFLEK